MKPGALPGGRGEHSAPQGRTIAALRSLQTPMTPEQIDAFVAAARAAGYGEVLERRWAPDLVLDTHTHPFAARALVTEGEMWLTVGAAERHLLPGDTFELEYEEPHRERYGPQGATYWVARRRPPVTG